MDIVDKLMDGLCGYKDVLVPAAEEIQALRAQLAECKQEWEAQYNAVKTQREHYRDLWKTTQQQLDIAVNALEKVALELGIDGLLKEWLFVDEALAAIQQSKGEAQHLG